MQQMYVINLNDLQGVELITSALRDSSCMASQQLANGIEKYLLYINTDGNLESVGGVPISTTSSGRTQSGPPLQVVK